VSLARALVMDPRLMLFDEPATGLDPILTAAIGQLIVDLHARIGFSSIAVTHNMNLAYLIGDRIAMLYNGRIIEVGTRKRSGGARSRWFRSLSTVSRMKGVNL